MNAVKEVYDFLYGLYGSRGWWPVTPVSCRGDAMPVYGLAAKSEKQRLEIILGAILAQNTSWKNAEMAVCELNKRGMINLKKLKLAKCREIADAVRSSGYYNQKAERIKLVADFLWKNPIRELDRKETGELRELFLGIRGIGPETADSILLYAFKRPVFVVDAYTLRMFSNLGIIDERSSYDEVQRVFMLSLDKDSKVFNEFHALIVEHGKRHYSKKPYGKDDPLADFIKNKKL